MDTQLWKMDNNLAEYEELVDHYEIFSFDIFDTILFRTVSLPDDIFHLVGKEALKHGLLGKGITALQYKHLRRLAQNQARRIKRDNEESEYTYQDIFDQFPTRIGQISRLKELEYEIEKANTYLNPSIYSLLNFIKGLGKKIILVSDMYFNKDEIAELLAWNQFDTQLVDDIIVSSDLNCSKADGRLFDCMLEKYIISNSEVVHIGDNYNSDYLNARAKGIRAIHYQVTDFIHGDGLIYERIHYDKIIPELHSIRCLIGNMTRHVEDENRFYYIFGAVFLGPFFTLFTEWLMDVLEEEAAKNVYLFMSEGVFFKKILDQASEHRNVKYNFELMYISRKSTYLATLDQYDSDLINDLLKIRSQFSVESLLDILGLKDIITPSIASMLSKLIKELNESERVDLESLLNDPTTIRRVNESIRSQKQLLHRYLTEQFDLSRIHTVDIGYRGSAAASIEKLLGRMGIEHDSTHVLAVMTENIRQNLFKGINFRGFCSGEKDGDSLIASLFDHCQIVETIINNDVLSTIGYQQIGNRIEPIFEEKYDCENNIRKKEWIQSGILAFQKLYLGTLEGKKITQSLYSRPQELLKVMNRVFVLPTNREAQEIGQFVFKNGFYNQDVYPFIKKDDLGESYWRNGAITIEEPILLLKESLKDQIHLNYNSNHYKAVKIVDTLLEHGMQDICIYGAGEAGKLIESFLRIFGLSVRYFVDSNPNLHGILINEVQVVSLDQALSDGCNNFVIGSFAFIDEIECHIKEGAYLKGNQINIVKYQDEFKRKRGY